jgi:hypothetical protein
MIDLGLGAHVHGLASHPDGRSFAAALAPDGSAPAGAVSRVAIFDAKRFKELISQWQPFPGKRFQFSAKTAPRRQDRGSDFDSRKRSSKGDITYGVTIVNSRRTGLALLNVAGILVILGSLYDLLVPAVPPNHLHYVGAAEGQLDPRYAQLDLAMLRSIGGCLLAIGVTTLILANGPILRGERWARVAVVILVGVSEGNNAFRMFPFDSPWYGPLGFALITAAGAALATAPHEAAFSAADEGLLKAVPKALSDS